MTEDVYVTALKSTLTEIKNICPDVGRSFLFTEDGTVITGDGEADNATLDRTVHFFQNLAEKAGVINGLNALSINGEKGKLYISHVDNMYLALTTSPNTDPTYLHLIVNVIVPTILKLLKTVAPTPLKFMPSQQLVVDTLTGMFSGDNVQVDQKRLEKWEGDFGGKEVKEVEIESLRGKRTKCGAKKIGDEKLQGKDLILMPEKVCRKLEVKKGDFVKIKPIKP